MHQIAWRSANAVLIAECAPVKSIYPQITQK